jgi:hypothetical protein
MIGRGNRRRNVGSAPEFDPRRRCTCEEEDDVMAIQIVMDHTGDTRHYFKADDTEALTKAEERFNALTSMGFTAAVRDAGGEVTVTRSFDPNAEETLFFPRLVGG